jgi:hypothetical protein
MKRGVGGGRAAAGSGFSILAVLKPKRRGRGDVRAPLDEGNGGGIGGASLPLPPSTGEHPLAAHGAAAPARAVAARALSDEGDDPGLIDRVGPPVSKREATAESDKQREGGDGRIGQAEQARQGGRRWATAGLENKGGGRAETISLAEIK